MKLGTNQPAQIIWLFQGQNSLMIKEGHGLWSRVTPGSDTSYMSLGKLFHLLVFLFPPPWIKDSVAFLMALLWELNRQIPIRHLEKHLWHMKHWIKINYNCHPLWASVFWKLKGHNSTHKVVVTIRFLTMHLMILSFLPFLFPSFQNGEVRKWLSSKIRGPCKANLTDLSILNSFLSFEPSRIKTTP